ncbi:Rad52/Rad22 family DNA repair protein [Sutcliffiella cohnii]|uniref:Rad52/Rad22 family DNA repair protein n=1 Tax=Sutcliffiella cohnii TaxID=33932 RepID=UPI0008311F03|nr:Rad52/Rad22 family DNA repair protein [Sutcliffiella cohnii]
MTDCTQEEIMSKLQDPFEEKDVEWRVQRYTKTLNGYKAIVMPYITNRAIMSRLDQVFGFGGWKNEFTMIPNGVKCRISFKVNDEWIYKEDGAELKAKDNIDPIKTAYSNSQKRCAVQLGIGRYLYSVDEVWVDLKERGQNFQKVDGKTMYWDTPTLPFHALPSGSKQSNRQGRTNETIQNYTNPSSDNQQRINLIQEANKLEKCLGLNSNQKLRIYQRVNPNTTVSNVQEIYKAELEGLNRYIDLIKAPAHIKKHIDNAKADYGVMLKWLSDTYGEEFKSFNSLITFVDQRAVDAVVVKLAQMKAA